MVPSREATRGTRCAQSVTPRLLAASVPTLAWDWDSLAAAPSGVAGPGGLGPGWVLAWAVDQGLAGWLAGAGRPLVLAAALLPAVVWVRRRPRRVDATDGLVLLAPLAVAPAWSPRDLVWPAVFGYRVDAVVRVRRNDPATCVPEATRPSGYVTPASTPCAPAGCCSTGPPTS